MSWRVEWTERALKDAAALDRQVRERVLRAIERLADTGQGDVRMLRGSHGKLRLKVGAWRVRFQFDHEAMTITILHVRPRGSAYRD